MFQIDSNVSTAAVAIGIAALLYVFSKVLQIGKRRSGLPPGPPALPILGNVHQIPSYRPHLQFQKWAKDYGPIYSLMMGTKTYIVLSSPTTVKDLLDKRSNIYSSRPEMFLGQEIASGGLRFVTMEYGPAWRRLHKMMHKTLNINSAATYIPYQDLESKYLMVGLLDQPKEFLGQIRLFTSSLTTQMVYGFRTLSSQDPRLLQFFQGFEAWAEIVGSGAAMLTDLYPILRSIPKFASPSVKHAAQLHVKEKELYLSHWLDTKARIESGTCQPCFGIDVLNAQETENFTDDQAGYICASLLDAGSDTTSSILVGFTQAMVAFPEVQKRAREEIDRVIGSDRMPEMNDSGRLPYIRACVKESLRWMPTVILGVPHAVTQDDEYMGYVIPKGSTIITNVWTINMDPERNPDPRVFDPSRFEGDDQTEFESATNSDPNQRQNWIFGSGRRLCQGMHLAERSLFLAIARMVWAFEFNPVLGADGKPISMDLEDLVGGIAVQPADFPADIVPRSKEKAEIIRKEWRYAEDVLLDPQTKQWTKVPENLVFDTYPSKAK